MAKVTTTIIDKQSGNVQIPNGEIVPCSVLSQYVLMNAAGKIVATLIDKTLAEKWVAEHKKGAIKFVKNGAA